MITGVLLGRSRRYADSELRRAGQLHQGYHNCLTVRAVVNGERVLGLPIKEKTTYYSFSHKIEVLA